MTRLLLLAMTVTASGCCFNPMSLCIYQNEKRSQARPALPIPLPQAPVRAGP